MNLNQSLPRVQPQIDPSPGVMGRIHPKLLIANVVARAVAITFGAEWQPRVVRYQKSQMLGSLNTIDYVVPCFELGKLLEAEPLRIAEKLAMAVSANMIKEIGGQLEVEAVGGYLNFQLTENYMQGTLSDVAHWFQKPHFMYEAPTDNHLLVIESGAAGDSMTASIIEHAYFDLQALYTLLGNKLSLHYLLRDGSGEAVADLSEAVSSVLKTHNSAPLSDNEKMSIRSGIKKALITDGYPDTNSGTSSEVVRVLQDVRKDWAELWKARPSNFLADSQALISESSIAGLVNAYLDDQTSALSRILIRDEANRAVYFAQGDVLVALRSVEGLLYAPAFILFVLDDLLTKLEKTKGSLVVLAPQRLHLELYEFAKLLQAKTPVVCFDAQVSKADILEIEATGLSMRDCLQEVQIALGSVKSDLLAGVHSRQSILSLVDLPLELNAYLLNHQFPAVFDLLNAAIRVANELRLEH